VRRPRPPPSSYTQGAVLKLTLTVIVLLFAAGIQSLTGFGLAILAVPFLLLLYDPQVVVPVIVLSGVALSVFLVVESRRQMRPSQIATVTAGALFGLPLGAAALVAWSPAALKVVTGATVAVFALLLWRGYGRPGARERAAGLLVGFSGGVCGGSTSLIGPPVILFGVNQTWERETFRANLIFYGAVTLVATLFIFGRFGLLVPSTLKVAVVALPAVILGFFGGVKLRPFLSHRGFRQLALGLSLLGGLLSLADGVSRL
jgi:uncharacterized membrane protein YfcA